MARMIENERPNPCRGCPDRYTACSDHCQKPEFQAWKAEQETEIIKPARRKRYSIRNRMCW